MFLVKSGSDPTRGLSELGPIWPRFDASVVDGMVVYAKKADDEGLLPDVDIRVMRQAPGRRFSPLLLDRFVRLPLGRDPSAAVARFASRYGRLGLCRHGMPNRHHDRVHRIDDERDCWDWFGSEPLGTWLYWARRARAMLELSEALKGWRDILTGEHAARTLVSDEPPYPSGLLWDRHRALLRQLAELWTRRVNPGDRPRYAWRREWPLILRDAVENWTRLGGLEYTIRWPGSGVIEPDLRYGDLFGLVGVQTLRRITSNQPGRRFTEVLYCQAPACGLEFERWQPHGRARYCRTCSESGVAQHLAEERRQAQRRVGSRRAPRASAGDGEPT